MLVYVIMSNDFPDSVFMGEERAAEAYMAERAKAYFDANRDHFGNDEAAYKRRVYWRLYPFEAAT